MRQPYLEKTDSSPETINRQQFFGDGAHELLPLPPIVTAVLKVPWSLGSSFSALGEAEHTSGKQDWPELLIT